MATQLFLAPHASGNEATLTRNSRLAADWAGIYTVNNARYDNRRLSTSRFAASTTVTSTSYHSSPLPASGIGDIWDASAGNTVEWISDPLAADVTISGTITVNIWMSESSMSMNAGAYALVDRISGADLSITAVASGAKGVELGTSLAAQNWTLTPTSTAFKKGDRIRFRMAINAAGGAFATGFDYSYASGAASAGVTGDSYVQFTETFSFQTVSGTPAGTTVYMTESAASGSINPGSANELEMWTSRGAVLQSKSTAWSTGTVVQLATGGSALEWYTRPLTAFTLTSVCKLLFTFDNYAGLCSARAELAVVNNDGTGAVVWATTGISALDSGYYPPSSTTKCVFWLAGQATSVTSGQRLRLRVSLAECDKIFGASSTYNWSYANPTGGSQGDCFLITGDAISEAAAATFAPPPIAHYRKIRHLIGR